MKKMWKLKKSAEAVSPVIATILMVAITVVLAAVLYVMVMGFGGNTPTTPTSAMTYQNTGGGVYRMTLLSITSQNVNGTNDVTIIVTPAAGAVSGWHNVNQYLGAGDYFTISGITAGTQYTVTLRYDASGGSMGSVSFVGA